MASFIRNELAVSPVVGTILMVAVTVALGATVLAIMSGVGDEGVQESTNAVFKGTATDTNGNGKTDVLKITYLSGPNDLGAADVSVAIQNAAGAALTTSATGAWDPGDFRIYDSATSSAGTWLSTVSVLGSTVLDQTIEIDE